MWGAIQTDAPEQWQGEARDQNPNSVIVRPLDPWQSRPAFLFASTFQEMEPLHGLSRRIKPRNDAVESKARLGLSDGHGCRWRDFPGANL
jgi:hypothetical protein